MLKSIIRTLLQKFIDDIDSDNCNITMEQQSKIISVLSNIANPAGTTTTLPIVFTSGGGGNAQKLTGYNGADITVSQIPGTGIYLCWFEHSTNTLQLLTGVV